MQNLWLQPAHSSYVRGEEWSWIGAIWLGIAVGVAYLLTAHLSLTLLTKPDCVAVFWPAAGIASGTLIALGPKARVPVIVAVWTASVAASLLNGRNFPANLVFAFCNAGETLLVAWLITHRFGRNFRLDSSRNVIGFFAAAGIGSAISAILATGGFVLFYNSPAPIPTTWLNWFASDALGIIMVAPLVIGLGGLRRDSPDRWELMEGTLTLVALAVVSVIAFGSSTHHWWYTILPFGLLLPALLAAHCRPTFAAAAILILGCAVVWSTAFGIGELGEIQSLPDRAFAARATLLAIATFTLILAALFAERRHSEAALRSSNNRLQLALGGAELGVWSLDTRTGHFESDARDGQIHGYPPEAPPPRTLAEARSFIHPDDLSVLDAVFAASKRTGGRCKIEYRLAPTAGGANLYQERWVALEGTVLRDANGQSGQLLGVTRDVTLHKHAERVLADRNLQLALAGKFALIGTYAYDVGSERYQVSPGYAAIHGLPEGTEETSRAEWRARVHPDDLPGVEAGFHQAIVDRRREYHCEYRFTRPDGEVRWIDSRNFISYDNDGPAPHLVGANIDVTQRKVTEAALKEHKASLADALVAGKVMAFEWDAVTCQTRRSDNATGILGDDESGSTSRRNEFLRRVHPDDRKTFKSHIGRLSPSNTSYVLNFRFCCPDGRQVWLEETAKGEFDATGKLLRIKGLTRDITERKQAEEDLRKSERKLRDLLGALPAAIYETDVDGCITYCNQAAVELWGTSPRLGHDKWWQLARFYHNDGAPMMREDCPTERALKHGDVRNLERILERPDGTRIPVMPYPTPLRDETGRIVGVVNMTVDISERKKAELALDERTLQLALAAKAARVGSYTYNIGSDVMQVSEGYAVLHGLPEGTVETTRSAWRARALPEDRVRVEEVRRQAVHKQLSEFDIEYRISRSGEIRWIESRSFVSYNPDGSPRRVIGINIDVTERKRTEDQQRVLVAELDHRVKNVLATVSAIVTQTQDAGSSTADFVAALDSRIKSLARAHELLSQSRWSGVSLAEIARCEFAPYSADNVECSGPNVTLKAEAAQAMAMVLHELSTNAAKYGAFSDRSGRVSLRWRWLENGSHGRLAIEWRESGGPPVLAPQQSSYGTTIIRELIPFELGGTVELTFPGDGVRCRMEVPAEWVSRAAPLNHEAAVGLRA